MFDRSGLDRDCVVIGIDPGLTRCGYGVLGADGARLEALDYGIVSTDPADPVELRLNTVFDALGALIERVRPSAVAVERVLFNLNVATAMHTGQAAGIVLLCCARAGVPVVYYTPTQVKAATAGFGAADKAQMRSAIARLLSLDSEPTADAADALALAFCHVGAAPLQDRMHAATGDADARRVKSRLDDAIAATLARDDAAREGSR